MNKLKIKPLSVNDAWKGRRFKTDKYKKYESDLMYILPRIKLPDPPFYIFLEFGFSSSSSDWDNPIKPFQDALQKKYGFNDSCIKAGHVNTVKTSKGSEYVKFKIMDNIDDLLECICDNLEK